MKNLFINTGLVFMIMLAGCTKNFDAVNTDPTKASASQFDPNLLLPTAEINFAGAYSGYSSPILFQSMWVQTFASDFYPSYYSNGDKYVASGNVTTYQGSIWNTAYRAAGYAYEIQNLAKDKPALSNLRNMAVIVEVLNMELITDVYGDCPYSQALKGKAGVSLPVYDKQQDIYNSMLSQLDAAISALDPSKPLATNDVFPYQGNITQWKKFGYSLMLRIAMRLTKADPATAQKYAEKAAAAGTFSGNADNAYVMMDHANGYNNANASALIVPEDYVEVKWSKPLIDWLRANNDPRLGVIAEVPQPGLKNAYNEKLAGDPNPLIQLGMPNGYDQNGGSTDISTSPGYPGGTGTGGDFNPAGKYSRPTTALYLSQSAPVFVLTYAETELLLAEAAARGWNVGGTAAQHYANGLSGALQTYATFNAAGTISPTVANLYAATHPLDITSLYNSL